MIEKKIEKMLKYKGLFTWIIIMGIKIHIIGESKQKMWKSGD